MIWEVSWTKVRVLIKASVTVIGVVIPIKVNAESVVLPEDTYLEDDEVTVIGIKVPLTVDSDDEIMSVVIFLDIFIAVSYLIRGSEFAFVD